MTRINLLRTSSIIIIMIETLKIFTTDNEQNDRLPEQVTINTALYCMQAVITGWYLQQGSTFQAPKRE